jgi:hypothetical protein
MIFSVMSNNNNNNNNNRRRQQQQQQQQQQHKQTYANLVAISACAHQTLDDAIDDVGGRRFYDKQNYKYYTYMQSMELVICYHNVVHTMPLAVACLATQ